MYVYVAILIAGLLAGGVSAYKVQEWRYGAKEKERLEAIERDRRIAEKRVDTSAEGHERDKVQIRKVFIPIEREVERVVEKPIYRNVCLDADGLRLVAAAVSAAPASEPPGTLPGPDTTR